MLTSLKFIFGTSMMQGFFHVVQEQCVLFTANKLTLYSCYTLRRAFIVTRLQMLFFENEFHISAVFVATSV